MRKNIDWPRRRLAGGGALSCLLLIAGCLSAPPPSESGPDGGTVEEMPGAPVAEVLIPVDGSVVESDLDLLDGKDYRLVIRGWFLIHQDPPLLADAEYMWSEGTAYDGFEDFDLGISLDDAQPYWGPPSEAHVYQFDYRGKGKRLAATLDDPNYGNNSGEPLVLEVYER